MTAAAKITPAFDVEKVRADFPILSRQVYGKPLVYLDSGASAQKPRQVLDAMTRFAETDYANVHRGVHYLSAAATDAYEAARRVAFIGVALGQRRFGPWSFARAKGQPQPEPRLAPAE